jgi:ubiquinone/menaquinone biosynthesis C-methylase UbiE
MKPLLILLVPLLCAAAHAADLLIDSKDSLATAGDFVHTELTPAGLNIASNLYSLLSEPDTPQRRSACAALAARAVAFDAGRLANRETVALGWLLEKLSEEPARRSFNGSLEAAYWDYFSREDFNGLKTYLMAQYKLSGYEGMDPEKLMMNLNLYQNALIYNSPFRVKWEPVEEIIKLAGLKPGDSVIDYGCRQGFYADRFRRIVGENGMVYCLDNDRGHIDFLQKYIVDNDFPNMLATKSTDGDLGLTSNRADMLFINQMYHFVYIYAPRHEQRKLLNSIKKVLRKNGRLIVLDNNPVKGVSGYSLDPRLVINQLGAYGFELKDRRQLTSGVYYLEFINRKGTEFEKRAQEVYGDGESLLHIGSLDSFELTAGGIEAGRLLWNALENGGRKEAEKALAQYEAIIPKENYGGEYTALAWLCTAKFFPERLSPTWTNNPCHVVYRDYFLADDAKVLREYLLRKYKLQKVQDASISDGLERKIMLEDYILFNNPRREEWERTSEFVKRFRLQEGTVLGDIGCGPGLYSWLLSRKVGASGRVIAMDLNTNHLDTVKRTCSRFGITNIHTHVSGVTSLNLPPDTLDAATMCSLYHIIYAEAEEERNAFVADMARTIKKGGLLYLIDNSPVAGDTLPYHSNYISKKLVIGQLRHYGFTLVEEHHFLPQRYLLVFRNDREVGK